MTKENASKNNSLDKEFEFYLKFTKPFVLNKSSSEDRALSVMWIKKLMNEKDKKLRLDYLKLLLYALQKTTMIGIFRNLPPDSLEPLPDGLNIMELIDKVLEEPEKENAKEKVQPTVSTAVSHDLTEYAAVQKIPNFGVQCFYATSPISINQWHLPSNYLFPRKYIHGADAWERSLSHLYHTDLAGHLVKNLKTNEKVTIDCCKDKPKPCKEDNEDSLKSDISGCEEDTNITPDCPKRNDRGPKSPPWSTAGQACQHSNHQSNPNNKFRWDEQSRLDSSYNIQPNYTLHEDFILNKHGLAQFETDQIALLLAHKSVQKNVARDKCIKKDKSFKCPKSRAIYNADMMANQHQPLKHIPQCIANDVHPSKLHLLQRVKDDDDDHDGDDDDYDEYPEATCKGKDTKTNKPTDEVRCLKNCNTIHPSHIPFLTGGKDQLDTKVSSRDSFDSCPWEDSPNNYSQKTQKNDDCTTRKSDDNTKKIPKTQQELSRMFEQEIPRVPTFKDSLERFNHYKYLQNKERVDELSKANQERQVILNNSSEEQTQILSLEQPFKLTEQPGKKKK